MIGITFEHMGKKFQLMNVFALKVFFLTEWEECVVTTVCSWVILMYDVEGWMLHQVCVSEVTHPEVCRERERERERFD